MFSEEHAARPVRFFERLLKFTVGRFFGKPFELLPWELWALVQIFGHVDSQGLRLIHEAFIEIAKKNGKTEWAAGLALYLLLCDNEPAAEVYGAAASRRQAGLVFNVASKMVAQNRELHSRLKVYGGDRKRIVKRADPFSFYEVVSSDATTGDGVNPSAVIFDEIHRQKNTELYRVLKFGMAARTQPLMVGITTAGATDESPLASGLHEKAVHAQSKRLDDPRFFGAIFQGSAKEWRKPGRPGVAHSRSSILAGGPLWKRKPTGWYASNPSLEGNPGGFLRLDDIHSDAADAERSPAGLNNFLRMRLNLWTESVVRWIGEKPWESLKVQDGWFLPEGSRCWIGGDLSSTRDVTAIVLLIEHGGGYIVWPRFYMPEVGIEARSRQDGRPYAHWAAKQWLTLTPGPAVNYDFIERDVLEYSKIFQVASVTIDRWNAQSFAQRLDDGGLDVRLISQGFGDISPGAKELERLITARALRHPGNPLMDWMVACTETQENSAGDIRLKKPDRRASSKRIDGVVALVNAVTGMMRDEGEADFGFSALAG